jgi:electron transfer flavoprotein beta subunit
MKIVTFVKQVPLSAAVPKIAAGAARIEEEGLSFEANETDLYAIEEALHQRSVHQGRVVAVTIGPSRAKDVLHVAHAKGVDQAIHVIDEARRKVDSTDGVAAAAALVKNIGFDAIFTGIQADDDLYGRFGVALADALDIPAVTAVIDIKLDPAARVARVTRELGGGYREEIEVDLPCLFTIQFGIRPVRYTSVMSVVKARSRKIDSMGIETLGIAPDAAPPRGHFRVVALSYPQDAGKCELIEGAPAEATKRLVHNLSEKGVI